MRCTRSQLFNIDLAALELQVPQLRVWVLVGLHIVCLVQTLGPSLQEVVASEWLAMASTRHEQSKQKAHTDRQTPFCQHQVSTWTQH